jgi:hypothetical protein
MARRKQHEVEEQIMMMMTSRRWMMWTLNVSVWVFCQLEARTNAPVAMMMLVMMNYVVGDEIAAADVETMRAAMKMVVAMTKNQSFDWIYGSNGYRGIVLTWRCAVSWIAHFETRRQA